MICQVVGQSVRDCSMSSLQLTLTTLPLSRERRGAALCLQPGEGVSLSQPDARTANTKTSQQFVIRIKTTIGTFVIT